MSSNRIVGGRGLGESARFALTTISLALLGEIICLVLPRHRATRATLLTGFFLFYTAAALYRMRAGAAIDPALVVYGLPLLTYPGTGRVIAAAFTKSDAAVLAIVLLAVVAIGGWTNVFSARVKGSRFLRLLVAVPLYLLTSFLFTPNFDQCSTFLRAAVFRMIKANAPDHQFSEHHNNKYPYLKVNSNLTPKLRLGRPHVFVLMIESFNQRFVELRTPDHREYTPFFNKLTSQGLYVERFYGNSVYTAQGQVATLCSILPSTGWDIISANPKLHLRALPAILRESGYRTVYFQGHADLDFNNTGRFMKRIGFSTVKSMDGEFIKPEESAKQWGWGLQDDVLYQKLFTWLDTDYFDSTKGTSSLKPQYFVTIATISNHAPFTGIPPSERFLYPNPKSRQEWYANTVRATDKYLETFFAELRKRDYLSDSLVFILGDHSFPMGEHGHTSSEVQSFEESFQVPFLMLGHSAYRGIRLREPAYSQLDLAPTILDMLDISTTNHFLGRSMVDPTDRGERIQHLIQPFDGGYLCAVQFPYKFVYCTGSGNEILRDLHHDPMELTNVVAQPSLASVRSNLLQSLSAIYLNEKLVKEDRIWPPETRP